MSEDATTISAVIASAKTSSHKKKKEEFEIGLLYINRARGDYYLAIDTKKLITVTKQGIKQKIPYKVDAYLAMDLSVEELCNLWKITLQQLDDLMAPYVTPSTNSTRDAHAPSLRNIKKENIEMFYKRMRTVQLVA